MRRRLGRHRLDRREKAVSSNLLSLLKYRGPANNGVGGVVIAGAIIANVGMARGVGLALLSPFTNAGRNGDSDICRFREPAGGVVS